MQNHSKTSGSPYLSRGNRITKKNSFPKTSGMKSLEDNYLFFSTQFEMNRG